MVGASNGQVRHPSGSLRQGLLSHDHAVRGTSPLGEAATPQHGGTVEADIAGGAGRQHEGSCRRVVRGFDDDDEIICTGLTLENRFWSIESIVKLGLIDDRGAWLSHRYSAIAMALPPVSDAYLRPH